MELRSMSSNPSKALERAAQRALTSDFFLASTLYEYQQANHLSGEALAALLGCDVKDLPRLALSRRPSAINESVFWHDIEHLAQRFHLSADQLTTIIRRVDSLRALRQHLDATSSAQGMLRAARDREDSSSSTGVMEDAND